MSSLRLNPVWVLLSIFFVFLFFGNLTPIYYKNRANLAFLHWSRESDQEKAELALRTAIEYGKKAGDMWMLSNQAKRAQALLERINAPSSIKERYGIEAFQNGKGLEQKNETEAALEQYLESCRIGNHIRRIQACYAAATISYSLARPGLFNETHSRLSNLQPEYLISGFSIDNFELIGYDLDELSLERDTAQISVSIYWKILSYDRGGNSSDLNQWDENGWKYFQIGERLYQVGTIANLFPNGGFEFNNPDISPLPSGYQDITYHVNQDKALQTQRHRIEVTQRGQSKSSVAVIVNEAADLNGITTISKLEVKPQEIFILSGWMRVDGGGRGTLGGIWRDQQNQDIRYWYIAKDILDQNWKSITGAIISPSGARSFTLLALNNSAGDVYLDNILMFYVLMPPFSY